MEKVARLDSAGLCFCTFTHLWVLEPKMVQFSLLKFCLLFFLVFGSESLRAGRGMQLFECSCPRSCSVAAQCQKEPPCFQHPPLDSHSKSLRWIRQKKNSLVFCECRMLLLSPFLLFKLKGFQRICVSMLIKGTNWMRGKVGVSWQVHSLKCHLSVLCRHCLQREMYGEDGFVMEVLGGKAHL